ncbi:hypothetical protein SSS_09961 [Sarcoptes scabiei]|uniref:Uncharacterized protein n=1 Tax=Sarcoptes scabiei TaxID=52283 RepID=A0A834R9A4_SARSC|nr:hypothetical protein SSS_09961 [Sarcoptes scabiei]
MKMLNKVWIRFEQSHRNFNSVANFHLKSYLNRSRSNLMLSLLRNNHQKTPSESDQSKFDQPIVYSKSKAYQFKAYENFRNIDDNPTVPFYNVHVIYASLIIFLVYFGILREPNDLDDKISRGLFEIKPDLEIPILEMEIQRMAKKGMDVRELRSKVDKLKQLQKQNNVIDKDKNSEALE